MEENISGMTLEGGGRARFERALHPKPGYGILSTSITVCVVMKKIGSIHHLASDHSNPWRRWHRGNT